MRKQKLRCKALCCISCRRLSVSSSSSSSSSEEQASETSSSNHRYASISSLAHAMVQEKLDQMIKQRQQHDDDDDDKDEMRRTRRRRRRRVIRSDNDGDVKFVVMVAMEKSSNNPREDFRESMVEMIMANRLEEPKQLRSLLNYYMSINAQDYHGMILEVFHDVCFNLFLSCKCH